LVPISPNERRDVDLVTPVTRGLKQREAVRPHVLDFVFDEEKSFVHNLFFF
jgi:hypothetical protein